MQEGVQRVFPGSSLCAGGIIVKHGKGNSAVTKPPYVNQFLVDKVICLHKDGVPVQPRKSFFNTEHFTSPVQAKVCEEKCGFACRPEEKKKKNVVVLLAVDPCSVPCSNKDTINCKIMKKELSRQEARTEVYQNANSTEKEICSASCMEACAS